MSKYKIANVEFKQNVTVNERFIIRVAVLDWNWIKNNIASWRILKTDYGKWRDLLG